MNLKRSLLTALALTLPLAGARAQSGSLDTTFMPRVGPNSSVNAIAVQPDGKTVFGGWFTQVNLTPLNRLARADADGNVDAKFTIGSGPDGAVNALALQGDGGILIAGSFTNFNGTPRPGLAGVTAGGSLDLSFNPGSGADGEVSFVAWQTNGQVIIQGDFTTFNGTPRLGLARLNADGSLDLNFDPGNRAANVSVLACQPDGKVVFSGSFTSLDGFAVTNLARLNADGSLDTNFCAVAGLNYGLNPQAHADSISLQTDGKILLSGLFTSVNGVALSHIARLNVDGTLDSSFNPGTGFKLSKDPFRSICSLAQPNNQALVWGNFSSFNGTNCSGVARLLENGQLDKGFNSAWGINKQLWVDTVALQSSGKMLVAPSSGHLTSRLRRYQTNGILDADWMSEVGANSDVQTILRQTDGKLIVGGWFSTFNDASRFGLVRLTADGKPDPSFTANVSIGNGVIAAALQPDGKLVVAGDFTSINGTPHTNVARLYTDGSLDTGFASGVGPDSYVYAVVIQTNGSVLMGGEFTTWSGEPQSGLVRLDASGHLDPAFNAGVVGDIYALSTQPDGKVLVGGTFTEILGVARTNVSRLNADGSLDGGFVPPAGMPYKVETLVLQSDGKILVAGSDRFPGTAIYRLHPDGSLDTTFSADLGESTLWVGAVVPQRDGRILIAGRFYLGGIPQTVVRLNPDGSWDPSFALGDIPSVYCLVLQSDTQLLLAGDFSYIKGAPRGSIARLVNDVSVLPVPGVNGAYLTTWAGRSTVIQGFAAGLPPLSYQWQCNGTNLPGQTNLSCSLANLAASDAGHYTLVVSNASGTATSAPMRLTVLPASARPGTFDTGFTPGSGADKSVWSLMEQTDGKLLVTGFFGTFNGEPHGGLVRLNRDGLVDTNFLASGVESGREVYWAMPQPDGKLLVGGWFNYFNGAPRTNLVRLHPDGRLDDSFTASVDVLNPDSYVYPMAEQPDGKILVGGLFSEVNGTPRNNLARLEPDGSLDSSFDPGAGADDYTWAIVLQPDGKSLVGGGFTHFNGVTRGGITRLNANGSMDASFNPGTAANGEVDVIVLQPDGKIVIGGGFSAFNGVPRSAHLARLNPDGSLDETFVPAAPAWLVGSIIYGVVLQADGKLVAGAYQSGGAAACVARFNPDGSLDSSYALGVCNSDGVWCMTGLANGQILVGGSFTDFNGLPAGRIVLLHGDEAITALLPFSLGTRWSAGVCELGLFGETGRSYTLERSTNLPQFQPWTNVTSTGTNWLADPESSTSPQHFYRARTAN